MEYDEAPFFSSIAGIAPGAYIFLRCDTEIIKIIISLTVIIISLIMLLNKQFTVKNRTRGYITVGSISGFLGASTSLFGPPLLLYLANEMIDKKKMRATLNAYFTLCTPVSIFFIIAGGYENYGEPLLWSIKLIPPMVAGVVVGSYVFKYLSINFLARLILVILIANGIFNIFWGFIN